MIQTNLYRKPSHDRWVFTIGWIGPFDCWPFSWQDCKSHNLFFCVTAVSFFKWLKKKKTYNGPVWFRYHCSSQSKQSIFFPQWQQGSLKPNLCAQTSKFEQHYNKKMLYGSTVSIRVITDTTSWSQLHKLAAIFRILVFELVLLAWLFRCADSVCFTGRRGSCDTLKLCPSFVLLFSPSI